MKAAPAIINYLTEIVFGAGAVGTIAERLAGLAVR
ncbi:MAG: iron-containing alcohol dehydrogenase, partial [Akkermansiaceae bacterium]|nr:iron-containing alcohol dehydrogenase [Akkermansiaceae bacterium]